MALVAGVLAYEWGRWPNGSPLLGPLGLVWYNGPDPANVTLCLGVGLLALAFPLRPGRLTAGLSAVGGLVWLALGVLAWGIGC